MREWLQAAVDDVEPVGVTDAVLGGAVRVLTQPRAFHPPALLDEALSEVTRLRDQPGVVTLSPGARL